MTPSRRPPARQQRSLQRPLPEEEDEDEFPDDVWPPPMPRSARWQPVTGQETALAHPLSVSPHPGRSPVPARQSALAAGRQHSRSAPTPGRAQRALVHVRPADEDEDEAPAPARSRPRAHWLLVLGLILCTMLLGWLLFTFASAWGQVALDDWRYGRPRTYQVDMVVGHHDSAAHPSHFIALNLGSHIEIIELPGGDASRAKIYLGPTLIGPGEDLAVVTLTFQDVNGDGKLDMIVSVAGSHFVFLNEEGQFRPARPGEAVSS